MSTRQQEIKREAGLLQEGNWGVWLQPGLEEQDVGCGLWGHVCS